MNPLVVREIKLSIYSLYLCCFIHKYWMKSMWKILPLITHVSNWTVSKVNKKSHWNCFSFSWSHWEEKGFSSMVFWSSLIMLQWGNLLKQLPLMRKPFHLAHPVQTQTTSSDWERGKKPFHGRKNSRHRKSLLKLHKGWNVFWANGHFCFFWCTHWAILKLKHKNLAPTFSHAHNSLPLGILYNNSVHI